MFICNLHKISEKTKKKLSLKLFRKSFYDIYKVRGNWCRVARPRNVDFGALKIGLLAKLVAKIVNNDKMCQVMPFSNI